MKEFKKKNSVIVIMIMLLITKILGFWKLRVFAQLFGASHELDIFWASFTIPDMIFMVLVAGSVNAAIIPILTDQLYDRGKKSLNELFKKITMYFFLLCFLFVLIAFILAPAITEWIINSESASTILNIGFRMTQADYPLFLRLFRIGLLSPLFLSISAFVTSYLQVRKQFFVTSLAPLFYDLAMIFGTYILVGIFKMDVTAIAISAVVGSVIHLAVQIPTLNRFYEEDGNEDEVEIDEQQQKKEISKAFHLAIPRMLGVLGEQISTVVNTIISFTLTAGALSAYKFANSLHFFPISIVGGAVAQVTLPDLAKFSNKKDEVSFKKVLNDSIQLSLYLVFPIVAVLLVLRLPIVRLVYGTGAFDWQDTILTSWSLALLTGSIIGQTIELILLRAFYALKNTWKPLISIFLGVVINLLGAYYLTNFFSHYYDWRPILEQIWVQISQANGEGVMPVIHSFFKDTIKWMTTRGTSNYAVGGLALSLSLSYLFQVIISSLMLNSTKKVITWKETVSPILKKIVNTLIMITGMYFLFKLFDFRLDTSRTVYVIILFIITSLGGLLLYLLGSKIFSPREYDMAVDLIKRIWNRIKNLNKNGNGNGNNLKN